MVPEWLRMRREVRIVLRQNATTRVVAYAVIRCPALRSGLRDQTLRLLRAKRTCGSDDLTLQPTPYPAHWQLAGTRSFKTTKAMFGSLLNLILMRSSLMVSLQCSVHIVQRAVCSLLRTECLECTQHEAFSVRTECAHHSTFWKMARTVICSADAMRSRQPGWVGMSV